MKTPEYKAVAPPNLARHVTPKQTRTILTHYE